MQLWNRDLRILQVEKGYLYHWVISSGLLVQGKGRRHIPQGLLRHKLAPGSLCLHRQVKSRTRGDPYFVVVS